MSWFTKDYNNYTDAIVGIIATLLWFVVGISCLTGIQSENLTFTAGWLMRIFVAFGVIEAILIGDMLSKRSQYLADCDASALEMVCRYFDVFPESAPKSPYVESVILGPGKGIVIAKKMKACE